MSIFTLDDGTFAGHTIRITPDHYASIYDVIKVASDSSNPHVVWGRVSAKVYPDVSHVSPSQTSLLPTSAFGTPPPSNHVTSDEVPMIKTYKFAGRGQRNLVTLRTKYTNPSFIEDTPVINGKGVVKLLFHLPGPKARAFIAEASEKLVRFIGGDESLIDEIRANRMVAAQDPNSMQHFMANNISSTTVSLNNDVDMDMERRKKSLELDEKALELKRMEQENARMEWENNQLKSRNQMLSLDVLDRYRQFAMDHIKSPRSLEHITGLIVNRVTETLGGQQQVTERGCTAVETAVANAQPSQPSSLVTIVKIGQAVAAEYRRTFPDREIAKVLKYVNSENRPVNMFPRDYVPNIISHVTRIINEVPKPKIDWRNYEEVESVPDEELVEDEE